MYSTGKCYDFQKIIYLIVLVFVDIIIIITIIIVITMIIIIIIVIIIIIIIIIVIVIINLCGLALLNFSYYDVISISRLKIDCRLIK